MNTSIERVKGHNSTRQPRGIPVDSIQLGQKVRHYGGLTDFDALIKFLQPLNEQEPAVGLKALIDEWPVDTAFRRTDVVESSPDLAKADTMLAPDARENVGFHEVHE